MSPKNFRKFLGLIERRRSHMAALIEMNAGPFFSWGDI